MKWVDLKPDHGMVDALNKADAKGARASLINTVDDAGKRQWSNRFADQCARTIADEARKHKEFRGLTVLPEPDGTAEMPTFVAGGKTKPVDVIVASLVSGLQIGFSLKGLNFRDHAGLQYDKNLTGRTYELLDEVRSIHGHQATSFLVAVYFTPLAATDDKKTAKSRSSFARIVDHLRSRTGRLDPTLPSQLARPDMSVVALYVPGDNESFTQSGSADTFSYTDRSSRGVVRYFDVMEDPPRRGRPVVSSTYGLPGIIDLVSARWRAESSGPPINWAAPEPD